MLRTRSSVRRYKNGILSERNTNCGWIGLNFSSSHCCHQRQRATRTTVAGDRGLGTKHQHTPIKMYSSALVAGSSVCSETHIRFTGSELWEVWFGFLWYSFDHSRWFCLFVFSKTAIISVEVILLPSPSFKGLMKARRIWLNRKHQQTAVDDRKNYQIQNCLCHAALHEANLEFSLTRQT